MKNVTLKYIGIIVIVGIVFILLLTKTGEMKQEKSIFNNEEKFWNVYIDKLSTEELNTDGIPYEGVQENGKDYVNYWVQACNAISQCYSYKYVERDEKALNQAKEIILNMKSTFDKYGKFPRPEYKSQNLEYGWVSSMDAPTIMVASQMLYELTGDTLYQDFVKDLKGYVLLNTEEGGYNFVSGGGVWPLEYAWSNTSEETNLYVLNGSLVGYIGAKAMSEVLNDEELIAYCKTVEKTYENKMDQFHYSNDEWTYYMLNPKTVIPIHYLIFEKKLFESIFYLSEIDFFQKEAIYREKLLKKALRVEFYEEENTVQYVVCRACSPNYYQIDTYGTRIEFYDNNNMLLEENECLISGSMQREKFYEGEFMKGYLPQNKAAYYKIYAVYNGNNYLLFQEEINIETQKKDYRKAEIEDIKALYDASVDSNGKIVSIKKELDEKTEGDVFFELKDAADWNDIFALEINNLSEEHVNIGLKIYDSKGNGATRYYMPLTEGKNLVVFDARGFLESDRLEDIKTVWLRFYDHNLIQEETNIELGELWIMDNMNALYECVTSSEYKINPQ